MPTGRGTVVLCAGLAMWVASRLVGSPSLGAVAVGLVVLPLASAWFAKKNEHQLSVRRRLSEVRVTPGSRVAVDLEVSNRGWSTTSFLLLEDQLPAGMGRSARLVMTGIPGGSTQRVRFTVVPPSRGRYQIGPLRIDVSDPFVLTRRQLLFDDRETLMVSPEIEDLSGSDSARGSGFGSSPARRIFRTAQDFYGMRPYQEGDDLRRIHWRSVARTGELMIRQDESTRRARALVFLDTRGSQLGRTGSPAFERAVSCAASLGLLLARTGFSLRLATPEVSPRSVTPDALLDILTTVSDTQGRSIVPSLGSIRSAGSAESSLVLITAPPTPADLAAFVRAAGSGPRLAVLVLPVDPGLIPTDQAAGLEGRASQARLAFARAGWEVVVISPSERLADVWRKDRKDRRVATG
jgi:uncharacterized protein (DUF58 family)